MFHKQLSTYKFDVLSLVVRTFSSERYHCFCSGTSLSPVRQSYTWNDVNLSSIGPIDTNRITFAYKNKYFSSRKYIWKCSLQNCWVGGSVGGWFWVEGYKINSSDPLFSQVFRIIKTLFAFWISRSYFTGVTSAMPSISYPTLTLYV